MEVIAEDGEDVRDEDDLESQDEDHQEKPKCPEAGRGKTKTSELQENPLDCIKTDFW